MVKTGMVNKYRVSCSSCKAFFEVEYGSKNKKIVYEIYSCRQCKNLFSVPNIGEELLCPQCGNKNLIKYNMNKSKNIDYYKKMMREGHLTQGKYNSLVDYWKNIESTKCPNCGKDALIWRLYEKVSL